MSVTNRAAIAALTISDLQEVVVDAGKLHPLEFQGILNDRDMESNPYKSQQVHALGAMDEKPEGTPFPQDSLFLGGTVTYNATSYGKELECTQEAWRDERYGFIREMIGEMATSWRHRRNVNAFDPLNNAFTGTAYLGYDGVVLCSTAHTGDPDGQTKSNRPSPDVAFGMTAVQAAILLFENMRTGRNLPMLMRPSQFVISPSNEFTAREVLGSLSKPDTANNNLNPIIANDLSWRVVHYFAPAQLAQWFLMAMAGQHDVNAFVRDEVEFDAYDDPKTGSALYTMWGRLSQGFGKWRGVVGSTGV